MKKDGSFRPATYSYHIEHLEPRWLLTTFALTSDMGQSAGLTDNAALAKSWNPQFIAVAGDVNNDHDTYFDDTAGKAWHSFISPYVGDYGAGSTTGNHFWPAIGNHDYDGNDLSAWHDFFTLPNNERYYTVRESDIQLFIVNANDQEPDGLTSNSVQGQWLKNALAASTAPWKLVLMHQPPFSSGWHGDTSYLQWPYHQWGASAVFNGHDHDYERVMKGDFPYFTIGLGGTAIREFGDVTTGSAVRWNDDWGIMRGDSTATSLTFRFYSRTGQLIDTYTLGAPSTGQQNTIIQTDATWSYLDNGSNQGTAWRAINFADSSWNTGAAELGYGDGDEATTVSYGSSASNKYITTYFRKKFTMNDPSAVTALNLSIKRDDGAVVYLNGTEIYRTNMPTGTISYNTPASTSVEEETFYTTSIDPALLVSGTNVIAVEVHQSDTVSTDVSFALQLNASEAVEEPDAPTGLTAIATGDSQINLNWTDNADNETGYILERSLNGASGWATVASLAANTVSYSNTALAAETTYYYRVRASNGAGESDDSNIASATTSATPGSTSLIPRGSIWKYLDNGSNAGTAWRAIAFNDTSWKSGAGELGYGDGDETTVVSYGPDANNKYVTTYFRKSFSIADPSAISALTMSIKRDDGAIVYLNGTEVYRDNFTDGATIAYNTYANVAVESDALDTVAISPVYLVAGTNVIAVEVHQSDPGSTDVSFDFQLTAKTTTPTGPTLPAMPGSLSAAAVSASLIRLTWVDQSSNETGFKIERSINAGAFALLATALANVSGYDDTSAAAGTTYTYRVSATNATGDSAPSNTATAAPLSIPTAPANLVATAVSGTQINLSWTDASSNESGFKLEISTDGVTYTPHATTLANATSYSSTSLTVGTKYWYRVRATNLAGDSSASNVSSATTTSTQSLIAQGSNWKYLDTGTNQGSAWRSTTFSDTTWKTGNAQFGYGDGDEATVVGYGTNANSKFVTTYFRKAFTVANPAAFTALALQLLRDDGAVVYLNGTELFRSNMPTGTISYTTLAASNLNAPEESTWYPGTINPSQLVAGTNVIAVELHQSVRDSSDLSFDLQLFATQSNQPVAPAAPTNLVATATSSSAIRLTWADNSADETGFKIERSADGTNFSVLPATVLGNVTSYDDTGLTSGQSYTYRVRATNSAGDSAASNTASATPLAIPAAPTGLSATVASNKQINLNWTDASSNETGFKIERSTDGTTYTLLTTTAANVVSYNDTGLTAGKQYWYRVRATNAPGDSAATSVVTATTYALPSPWIDGDIGTVGLAGTAYANAGVYTVSGAGSDIGGTSDSMNFAYRTLSGNGTIITRIASQQNTGSTAEAGIMIRDTLNANAREASLVITPSGTVQFQRRTTTGGTTTTTSNTSTMKYIRLVRSGNTITASRSSNGTTWTTIGSATVTMGTNVFVGLVVTSRSTSTLNTSTFDSVSVT